MRRTASATVAVLLLLALAACTGSPSSSEPTSRRSPSERASSGSPTEPASSSPPSPPSYKGEVVRGWPTTSRNPAGVYSWDGRSCAGGPCIVDFMHNGYGSGDVTLNIERVRGGQPPGAGWTAATVAGHDGLYRRTAPRQEAWLVEVEGTTIAVHLTTRRGTRQVELDEGHAIIDSMSTEEQDTELGFRLVFRLTTNDWDSG